MSLLLERVGPRMRAVLELFSLAAGTAVVTAWYWRGWAAALAGSLPGGSAAAGWCGLALGCLLLNWGSGVLRQRVGGHLRPLV